MAFTVQGLLDSLVLAQTHPGRFTAGNVDTGHSIVFGGQLMAQSIAAASIGHEGKTVKTLHIVFARAAAPDKPVEIIVDPVHSGRTLASCTVTISQGERICTRSMVLLSANEQDAIRHADRPRTASDPDDIQGSDVGGWQVRVVGGVDISDPEAVGPPELDVWSRFVGAPDDPMLGQALLAYATDGFLIGTAMRPHAGVGQALAHKTFSTGVLSHTITFHEPLLATEWLLLSQCSPYAGNGRSYGRADVFRRGGQLVASFVQDNMIRAMRSGSSGL
ncbi:acyl-CoA thioesterase II [Mycobacterium mantenii]|uniref:Acyl-CoA thioesterase II n=1 Tax=Mycobacterium mantenii TaxID=560555 RepID=A0A1X0F9H9_MYCNT|nr:acyl-CoA thioesterase domain-containing protein [Mycobacterium mantenii]MCV7246144.1 thioesterase family protein [Mycobacterium mantenii]ORA97829.1 acyl-CoA thioesterase II [Mycobacterium mantenii]BBY37988.1 acyl-CoA thioesterase II [Mycobacterium mantenii]